MFAARGSIRQRSRGSWTITFDQPRGADGKRRQKSITLTGTKKQAQAELNSAAAAYSMKYPEGWAQLGSGNRVVFRDKNNVVRVIVSAGALPTKAGARRDLLPAGGP